MLRLIGVTLTDIEPMRPADADFGVTIDFVRGESDPAQVFSAMAELLAAFSDIDRVLAASIAPQLEPPITVIEDIEAASITAWLRKKIEKVDDRALQDFDLKKQIGAYAVKGKYRILKFLDDRAIHETTERRRQPREDLEALANEMAPSLAPPTIDIEALIPPMNEIQAAKRRLDRGEAVVVKSSDEVNYKLDTGSTAPIVAEPEPALEAVPEVGGGDTRMILLIKKADLLGNSQWEFRHGKNRLVAKIEDQGWLERFHSGDVTLSPGARMRAIVRFHHRYNKRDELVGSECQIIRVDEIVMPSPEEQQKLFAGEVGEPG